MKKERIQEKIKEAIEIVKYVEEPFKVSAFEIVFNRLLEESEDSTQNIIQKGEPVKQIEKSISHGFSELAKKCNITIEQLNDFIILKDDDTAELLVKLGNDLKEKERQVQSSQCIILALEYGTGQEWIDPVKLSKSIEHSGISSSHISRTLEKNNRIFKGTGKGRGKKYKLSGPGRIETFELIQKLVKNN